MYASERGRDVFMLLLVYKRRTYSRSNETSRMPPYPSNVGIHQTSVQVQCT